MNQPLPGVLFPRYRLCFKLRVCLVAVAMAALFGCGLAAAAPPTKTRTAHVRKGSAVPVATARVGAKKVRAEAKAKPGARTPSRKPGARQPGARQPGAGQAGVRAKRGAAAKPGAKSRRRSRQDEAPIDMPTMYRVRLGRGGRRRALTTRERLALLRSVAVRNAAFEAAASASPLRGTHEVLVHQNLMASGEGLTRILDDDDLDRMRGRDELVDFTPSRSLRVNPELPENRRCARAWTVQFAEDLAEDFYARFGEPLIVTSAARSVTYQRRLTRVNGNAAGIEGDSASPHLTGQAIDIGKRGMSRAQLAWMRDRLLPMMQTGEIDVEEEFRQACFHISVYRSYLPVELLPGVKVAQVRAAPVETPAEQP